METDEYYSKRFALFYAVILVLLLIGIGMFIGYILSKEDCHIDLKEKPKIYWEIKIDTVYQDRSTTPYLRVTIVGDTIK